MSTRSKALFALALGLIASITLGGRTGARAGTDACAPLHSPSVAKALGAPATVGTAFDPRGKGPLMQQVSLQGATDAQTCVAKADVQTELRATIVTYPDEATMNGDAAAARTALMKLPMTWKTGQTTVAGQKATILQGDTSSIHTYTIAASKGTVRYSMSAQAARAIDASAMSSLLAQLMQ